MTNKRKGNNWADKTKTVTIDNMGNASTVVDMSKAEINTSGLTNRLIAENAAHTLTWQNTQYVLGKASKFMKTTPNGTFVKPSLLTVILNWKVIIEIILELLVKFIEPKTSPYWDSKA